MEGSLIVSTYDNIADIYEKWSSGDAVYHSTARFYLSVLTQMNDGKYLELGIGTGRITLEAICSTPISITGIDASKKMLEICNKKYKQLPSHRGTLELYQGDMLCLPWNNIFHGAIMPFRTIGHFTTDESLNSLFKNVSNALKPGGWFLLDHYVFQRKWAETHNNVPILMYQDNEFTIYDNYNYDFENNMMHCKVLVNDEIFEEFDFRWLSPQQIYSSATLAGFDIVSLMGEFDASPWKKDSLEQIWLLQKPGNTDELIHLPKFSPTKKV
mgnify:CR=1 FL=1